MQHECTRYSVVVYNNFYTIIVNAVAYFRAPDEWLVAVFICCDLSQWCSRKYLGTGAVQNIIYITSNLYGTIFRTCTLKCNYIM